MALLDLLHVCLRTCGYGGCYHVRRFAVENTPFIDGQKAEWEQHITEKKMPNRRLPLSRAKLKLFHSLTGYYDPPVGEIE